MSLPSISAIIACSIGTLIACFSFEALSAPAIGPSEQPFGIDDYFRIKRVVELSLSSDGQMVAYAVESISLEKNEMKKDVYVGPTTPGAEQVRMEALQHATNLAWIPGTHELAYLSEVSGVVQLFSINIKDEQIQQHSDGIGPVLRFWFAPTGMALAWLTRDDPDYEPSHAPDYRRSRLYDRLFNGDKGVVIDPENTFGYQFIDPDWPDLSVKRANKLWLKEASSEAVPVAVPGPVKSIHWSSDASKLSVVYSSADVPEGPYSDRLTSLGVFDVMTKSFKVLARAHAPSGTDNAVYYSGGEWLPGADKLFVRCIKERDLWVSNTAWALFDLATDISPERKSHNWHEIEVYGVRGGPAFLPVDENTVYSNKTVRARQSLYTITPSGVVEADMLKGIKGSVSLISFSADFSQFAFVNESRVRPPEIHIWRKGREPKRLTGLNDEIAGRRLPAATEVSWKSKDGVTVYGWLLEPVGEKSASGPWPLVTFVQGGPGIAVLDKFAYYFKAFGGIWPHPSEVLALHGMAVLLPNYRSTRSFGDDFADPKSLDGEPVDDIVSGIEYLISEGIADANRLAISGHSHGAWLASLVMTRTKLFRAGSFAEGSLNKIVTYSSLGSAWQNRYVHDIKNGVSLYDDPQRYIDLSPEFHFTGLDAAVLFEAGAKGVALGMLSSLKAARSAGMPAEFIVYPQTGHNIRMPRLKKESAERNLDWFRFWLLGEEDADPIKFDQYESWRKMRLNSEAKE